MNNMRNKILSLLVLLLTAASGAWAEGETLLLTIENKDYPSFKSGSMTFDDKVTVTFSNTVSNWGDSDGWYSSRTPSLLTVAGTNGYTITSCKFYTNSGIAKTGYTVEGESPSVYLYNDSVYTDASKSLKIGYPGITKIEVYGGVASSEPAIEVTTNAASEGATFTEASFQMPAFDATADYELVRDITQQVDLEVRIDGTASTRIRIAKDTEGHYKFVTTEGWQYAAVDKINNVDLTNGELNYSFKKKEGEEYVGKPELSPGIWRLEATANEGKPYVGTIYGHDIELYAGYDITVPAGEYVTYFKNEKIKVEDANAELYTITTVGETTATLSSKLNVAPASTPLLVYNNSTEQKTFLLIPATEDADAVTPASQFKGTLEAASIPASTSTQDNYALNGKAFVWVKNALNISANKCWLQINYQLASTRANTRSIVGGNGTTGIDAATSDDNEGDYYDLQGRKVEKPNRKGIYIQNGKKVIVR